jgi:predicted DNA-binding WGR domain protein
LVVEKNWPKIEAFGVGVGDAFGEAFGKIESGWKRIEPIFGPLMKMLDGPGNGGKGGGAGQAGRIFGRTLVGAGAIGGAGLLNQLLGGLPGKAGGGLATLLLTKFGGKAGGAAALGLGMATPVFVVNWPGSGVPGVPGLPGAPGGLPLPRGGVPGGLLAGAGRFGLYGAALGAGVGLGTLYNKLPLPGGGNMGEALTNLFAGNGPLSDKNVAAIQNRKLQEDLARIRAQRRTSQPLVIPLTRTKVTPKPLTIPLTRAKAGAPVVVQFGSINGVNEATLNQIADDTQAAIKKRLKEQAEKDAKRYRARVDGGYNTVFGPPLPGTQ